MHNLRFMSQLEQRLRLRGGTVRKVAVKTVDPEKDLENLVEQVRQGDRYREIDIDLIRSIGRRELRDRRKLREAVKATRAKLHQVGGAYLEAIPDYASWREKLVSLPAGRKTPELREFCMQIMHAHASTRERLPILDTFYSTTLSGITPINSVLDLACGLNPMALPWMPLDCISSLLCLRHLRRHGRIPEWIFHTCQPERSGVEM